MTSRFPDEPLLGMFVGRTVRQLILFCDYVWTSNRESEHSSIFIALERFRHTYPDHPMTALAEAAWGDAEFISETVSFSYDVKAFDAIAHHLIWRFLRAELKGRPGENVAIEEVQALLSASLASCFIAFNTIVLGKPAPEAVTSYELPDKEAAFKSIDNLKYSFPLMSELLGFWYPHGDRQFYFFNSDFDYLSEYRGQSAV